VEVVTSGEPRERGAQLSLKFSCPIKDVFSYVSKHGGVVSIHSSDPLLPSIIVMHTSHSSPPTTPPPTPHTHLLPHPLLPHPTLHSMLLTPYSLIPTLFLPPYDASHSHTSIPNPPPPPLPLYTV